MWYVKLLEYLVQIICKREAENAVEFINNLFDIVHQEELEPIAILGFLTQFYNFTYIHRYEDIPLSRLARYSIGLIILHFKSSREDTIYTSSFADLFEYPKICEALNLQAEIISVHIDFLSGQKEHPDIIPITRFPTFEQSQANNLALNRIVHIYLLKQMELNAFLESNHRVGVDITEVFFILNSLLNKVEPQKEILINLRNYILPYKNQSKELDQLINELNKALKKFPAQNPFLEPIDEDKGDFSVIDLKEKRKIHLVLIPKLPMHLLPQFNPAIIFICKRLERYTPLPSWNRFCFFFCGPLREHTEEIASIVKQIKKGDFPTVTTIITRLCEIKRLNRRDDLHQFIEFIKEKYRDDSPIPLARN